MKNHDAIAALDALLAADAFEEGKHPRDQGGKFSSGGVGTSKVGHEEEGRAFGETMKAARASEAAENAKKATGDHPAASAFAAFLRKAGVKHTDMRNGKIHIADGDDRGHQQEIMAAAKEHGLEMKDSGDGVEFSARDKSQDSISKLEEALSR